MPGSRSRWRTMTAGASVCPAANQCGASRRSSVRMVVTGDAAREDAVPPRSVAPWSRQMWLLGKHRGGEPMPKGAAASRARSLRRQTPAWRLEARARRRARELVRMVAAARARVAQTMAQQRLAGGGAVWIAAAEEGWERARGAWMARAAGVQEMRD